MMLKKNNLYSLNQSPLYKLHSRKKLAHLLRVSIGKLEYLANSSNNYHVRPKIINNKARQLELPKLPLQQVHFRLFKLLQRIEPPGYLHSGVRGKSYITNAQVHIGEPRLMKVDIEKFFPSTLKWHVYQFFHSSLLCSKDVSALLAKISTYDDYIPTGSSLSQIIAFYAHYNMFEKINQLTMARGLKMTCYVDDITISGKRIDKGLLRDVRRVLKSRGLKSNPDKDYLSLDYYAPREVTGLIVTKTGLRLPNKKHKDIHDSFLRIPTLDDDLLKLNQIESLIGKVTTASLADESILRFLKPLQREHSRLQYLKPIQKDVLAQY